VQSLSLLFLLSLSLSLSLSSFSFFLLNECFCDFDNDDEEEEESDPDRSGDGGDGGNGGNGGDGGDDKLSDNLKKSYLKYFSIVSSIFFLFSSFLRFSNNNEDEYLSFGFFHIIFKNQN
jgi:hypothetical protein